MKCLTNIISYSKKFSFSGHNVYYIINNFHDNLVSFPNMWDHSSNAIFDTCIRDNKYSIMIIGWILVNILKFILMSNSSFNIFAIHYIKGKKSGKIFIKQNPRVSSLFRLSKTSKTWLRQLLVSTMRLLTFKHCLKVRWLIAI